MKKFIVVTLCMGAILVSCKKEGHTNVAPVCSLESDAAGKEIEPEDKVVFKGTASDKDGTISSVILKVNGTVVETVTAVPFEYELTDAQKTEGEVKVALEVTDNDGESASAEASFTVLGRIRSFTDPRDNKTYKTVKIGSQLWFGENLAWLPSVNKPGDYSKDEPRYYVFGYNGEDVAAAKATEHYKKYGALYNWKATGGKEENSLANFVKGVQGPCPDGWHVPARKEFEDLYSYVRSMIPEDESAVYFDGSTAYNVNGHLLAKNAWVKRPDPDFPQLAEGAFDTYDFSVYPVGCSMSGGFYYGPDDANTNDATFWTQNYDWYYTYYQGGATTSIANYRYEPSFSITDTSRGYGIRCIKD